MSTIEMARLIRSKKLSAREALAAHLKHIERVNPKVNAIVTLVPEMAADAAAKADEMQAHKEPLGKLHGLPVAHKDLRETSGIRTTYRRSIKTTSPPKTTLLWNDCVVRAQSPSARRTPQNLVPDRKPSTGSSARRTIPTT
jgi:amidase